MKHTLVGHTGFVGGNLLAAHAFDGLYNSSNIEQSFGADNGLVIYSGMASEKFLADAHPEQDLKKAEQALDNMRRMRPEKLVLISTVDVYPHPVDVDENTPAGGEDAAPYGANRCLLEQWTRETFPTALIVRLPALLGRGLKKNFIYDMLTLCPPMLRENKYRELAGQSDLISRFYKQDASGFYRLCPLSGEERAQLKAFFSVNDFNSLAFTDTRSVFQFYDLSRLWKDIEAALAADLRLVNMATQPMSAGELYTALYGGVYQNHLPKPPFHYDMRTRHCGVLGGTGGYIMSNQEIVEAVRLFSQGFLP